MQRIHHFLLARRRAELVSFAVATGLVLALLDYATGWVLSFAAFYLVPVALCGWYVSRRAGNVAAVACAITWALANRLAGEQLPPAIWVWNAGTRLVFFVVTTWLLSELRSTMDRLQESLRREQALSRVDPLTGVRNPQGFRELAELELRRAARYHRSIGLVFFDLDGFKQVNDSFGHAVGDHVLRLVGEQLMHMLRRTDVVGRLGGDEFAILLPETDLHATELLLQKVQHGLTEALRSRGWPVTSSIGAVVTVPENEQLDWILEAADRLMYRVKAGGKDGVLIEEVSAPDAVRL